MPAATLQHGNNNYFHILPQTFNNQRSKFQISRIIQKSHILFDAWKPEITEINVVVVGSEG